MVRIGLMASRGFELNRRTLITGLGAAVAAPAWLRAASAQSQTPLAVQAKVVGRIPHLFGPPTESWSLAAAEVRPTRGDTLDVTFTNNLPVPVLPVWRGLDGVPAAEPLLARQPVTPGLGETLRLPLRHAGTGFCELGLLLDGLAQPSRGLPLIVREREPVPVDRDEVLLIEEWRVRPDGTPIAPGVDPKDATSFQWISGFISSELKGIPVRANERLRLRLINASHRSASAFKIEGLDVRVMAIDGQPAEPFSARNGAVVLAAGTRVDVFVDVIGPTAKSFNVFLHDGKQIQYSQQLTISDEAPIRPEPLPPAPPLPSNGLPAQLELKGAQRFELMLNGNEWVAPAKFATSTAPAFRIRKGRVVVLALTNRATIATVFHLHGHHFRLLDRLDDGWKPYWLDTLAIEPGQTQRIAFAAETAGRWLIESTATDWAAPNLVRWYSVE
jgi:FtsP/CotA-like multicopper oxidase with cupredoxin domain